MSRETDPSLHRRRLRVELRRAREEAGLSQREAAETLEWSLSKLIRIEGGTVSISVTDIRAVLQLYGVAEDSAMYATLVEAARGSRGQPWWWEYHERISKPYAQYLGYETAASSLHVYHPFLVPGLLQTEDFAHALLTEAPSRERADALVRLRMRRQEKLYEDATATLRFLVQEAALHPHIGGPSVMHAQLARIAELARRDRVSVRVVPYEAGAHPALGSGFVLLGFTGDDDVLFQETAEESFVSRDDHDLIVAYRTRFEKASDRALPEEDSLKLIGELMAAFEREDGAIDTAGGHRDDHVE
jgi:transcriptional regulator with XRE-family HTH domain